MRHQIIFLNGPPGSGKDLAARFLVNTFSVRHRKFAAPLKEGLRSTFSITDTLWKELETEGSQAAKDTPRAELFWMSWRELCIWYSEQVIKPKFGPGAFGKLAVNALRAPTSTSATVFSDCGFKDEVEEVINVYGSKNCHLFHLHRDDCTFEGDSRSYIEPPPGVTTYEINNNFEKLLYRIQICKRVNKILGLPEREWG